MVDAGKRREGEPLASILNHVAVGLLPPNVDAACTLYESRVADSLFLGSVRFSLPMPLVGGDTWLDLLLRGRECGCLGNRCSLLTSMTTAKFQAKANATGEGFRADLKVNSTSEVLEVSAVLAHFLGANGERI